MRLAKMNKTNFIAKILKNTSLTSKPLVKPLEMKIQFFNSNIFRNDT